MFGLLHARNRPIREKKKVKILHPYLSGTQVLRRKRQRSWLVFTHRYFLLLVVLLRQLDCPTISLKTDVWMMNAWLGGKELPQKEDRMRRSIRKWDQLRVIVNPPLFSSGRIAFWVIASRRSLRFLVMIRLLKGGPFICEWRWLFGGWFTLSSLLEIFCCFWWQKRKWMSRNKESGQWDQDHRWCCGLLSRVVEN